MKRAIFRQLKKTYLLEGISSALLFLFLGPVGGGALLFSAQIPLFMIGFKGGFQSLPKPLVLAMFLVFGLGGINQFMFYCILVALPSLVLIKLALQSKKVQKTVQWYPAGRLLYTLMILGLLMTTSMVFIYSTDPQGDGLTRLMQLPKDFGSDKKLQTVQHAIDLLIPFIPSMMGLTLIFLTILSCVWAQNLTRLTGKMKRPPIAMTDIYLPWNTWYILTGVGLGWALIPKDWGLLHSLFSNGTIVVLTAFFFQGMSIVHIYGKKLKNPQLFLVLFYFFVVMFTWPILILIMFGIIEPWALLREKIKSNKE